MIRLIALAVVARALANQPSYVRRIAADQGRPAHSPTCECAEHRRYPQHTHERFPLFVKDGHEWKAVEHEFREFMERRGREWTPRID